MSCKEVAEADHYWLDYYDSYNLDKAITFFSKAKEELALTQ
jgi:cation diffusion facilitator CzcD-associated flavoprotein CzcO